MSVTDLPNIPHEIQMHMLAAAIGALTTNGDDEASVMQMLYTIAKENCK